MSSEASFGINFRLVKKDDLGFVYVDDSGNPKRNPNDVSKFLTPKDMIETEGMKKFIGTITGVPSSGDGFAGGEFNGGGEQKTHQTFAEKQKAFLAKQ